jgi:hypothetical protein
MLKGKRLQSGKYVVEIDTKAKGKRRKKKPPSETLTSLEKIQLHINKVKGLPTPKVLPKLTDEEYLVFQSKLTDLKNVNIGINKFGAGEATTFAKPILQTDPSYPQIPQGMPVNLPPQITQGYDIINGNIIPAPLPSRLDMLTSGRRVDAPDQQNPNRPSYSTFGHHAGAGQSRHSRRLFNDPEYIGPDVVRTRDDINRDQERVADEERLKLIEAVRDADRKRSNIRERIETGRGARSDAGTATTVPTRQRRGQASSTQSTTPAERADLAWDMASNPSRYPSTTSYPSGFVPDVLDTTASMRGHQDFNRQVADMDLAEFFGSQNINREMGESETEYRDRLRRLYDFQYERRTVPDEAN